MVANSVALIVQCVYIGIVQGTPYRLAHKYSHRFRFVEADVVQCQDASNETSCTLFCSYSKQYATCTGA
jgi:hypothetical protein